MAKLSEFFLHHWLLVSAFVVALVALIVVEVRSGGTAGGARLAPARAVQFINQEKPVILDIRSIAAFNEGHIINAINIPVENLAQQLKPIEKYKQRPVLIVCNTGGKSVVAMAQLKKAGFQKIYILAGGLQAWKNASMPLKKETKK